MIPDSIDFNMDSNTYPHIWMVEELQNNSWQVISTESLLGPAVNSTTIPPRWLPYNRTIIDSLLNSVFSWAFLTQIMGICQNENTPWIAIGSGGDRWSISLYSPQYGCKFVTSNNSFSPTDVVMISSNIYRLIPLFSTVPLDNIECGYASIIMGNNFLCFFLR